MGLLEEQVFISKEFKHHILFVGFALALGNLRSSILMRYCDEDYFAIFSKLSDALLILFCNTILQ